MLRHSLFLLIATLAAPLAAQETRVVSDGHIPPPATIDEAAWLVGDWVGIGIESAPAAETWLPPMGGAMVGLFAQESPAGELMFTEHMYLLEEEGSLALKLKHFNGDLTGWEEKDEMVRFPLISIEPCAAYFNALTYRCDEAGGLIVAVRMKSEGDTVKELVFRYTRRGGDEL